MLIDIDHLKRLSDTALIASTQEIAAKERALTTELVLHIAEIDARRLYLELSHPSLFAFCVTELGWSEDATYNRIAVARLTHRLPAVIEALRSGRVHLTGLKLLAPHLTEENHVRLLAEASGKSKREIEELVARIAPRPDVPDTIRKLPSPAAAENQTSETPPRVIAMPRLDAPLSFSLPPAPRPAPLSDDRYRVQYTANERQTAKLKEAQDLLRHRIPDGDLARIVELAIDLLIIKTKKERFAVGKTPRKIPDGRPAQRATSRHIPDAIKRAVYERDAGRCTFVDRRGHRCESTALLELDHADGFAITQTHDVDRIRLRCRAHNQYAADGLYGRSFMDRARDRARDRTPPHISARSGTGPREPSPTE